jgi:Rrf2 family transcriptional regulator, iron-sulfur cluster assembly transcription factor
MGNANRCRLGIRLALALAASDGWKPLCLDDIAAKENVALHDLLPLIDVFGSAGVVKYFKWPLKGYVLRKHPDSVTIHDILKVISGNECSLTDSQNPVKCQHLSYCGLHDMGNILKEGGRSILLKMTLSDLLRFWPVGNNNPAPEYFI